MAEQVDGQGLNKQARLGRAAEAREREDEDLLLEGLNPDFPFRAQVFPRAFFGAVNSDEI